MAEETESNYSTAVGQGNIGTRTLDDNGNVQTDLNEHEEEAINIGASGDGLDGTLTDEQMIERAEQAKSSEDQAKKEYMANIESQTEGGMFGVTKEPMSPEEAEAYIKEKEEEYDEALREKKIQDAKNAADPDYIPPSGGLDEYCTFTDEKDNPENLEIELRKISPEYDKCMKEKERLDKLSSDEKKKKADAKQALEDQEKKEAEAGKAIEDSEKKIDNLEEDIDTNTEVSEITTEKVAKDKERLAELQANSTEPTCPLKSERDKMQPYPPFTEKPPEDCPPEEPEKPKEPNRETFMPGDTGQEEYEFEYEFYEADLAEYNEAMSELGDKKDACKTKQKEYEAKLDAYNEEKENYDKIRDAELAADAECQALKDAYTQEQTEIAALTKSIQEDTNKIKNAESSVAVDSVDKAIEEENLDELEEAEEAEEAKTKEEEKKVEDAEDKVEDAEDLVKDQQKKCDKLLEDLADKYPATIGKAYNKAQARKEEQEDCLSDNGDEIECLKEKDACIDAALGTSLITDDLTEEQKAAIAECEAAEKECNKGFFESLEVDSRTLLAGAAIVGGALLMNSDSCFAGKFKSITGLGGGESDGCGGDASGAVGPTMPFTGTTGGDTAPGVHDKSYLHWDAEAAKAMEGVLENMIADHLQPTYKHAFVGEFPGKLGDLDWLVRTMDRPKMDVEYVEQIRNNVKRQYPIKYNYGDLNMTFHDDVHHKTITLLHKFWGNEVWKHKSIKGAGKFQLRDSIIVPIIKVYDLSIETGQHLCYTYKNVGLTSIDYDAPDEAEDGGIHTIQVVFKIEGFDISIANPSVLNPGNSPIWKPS